MPGIRRKSKDKGDRTDSKSGSRSPRRNKTVLQGGIYGRRNKTSNDPLLSPLHSHESLERNGATSSSIGNNESSIQSSTGNRAYTTAHVAEANTLSYSNSDDKDHYNTLYHDNTDTDQNYSLNQGLSSMVASDDGSHSHESNAFQQPTPTKSNQPSRNSQVPHQDGHFKRKVLQEPEIVDAIYEEKYGENYIDKPIRYIYPHGYGSMRPRSWPWKISIVSTIVFAWLNVFIVGHCSDRYELNYYRNDDQYQANYMDDNAAKIETRWCGSQILYFMWVLSVMITGLSCAYCSIIGYVKARDFAVGNGRSQPPGMVGNSDYYVQMENGSIRFKKETTEERDSKSRYSYRKYYSGGDLDGNGAKIIYQADGTPRFFGGKIYHPNQAAVNMTSR